MPPVLFDNVYPDNCILNYTGCPEITGLNFTRWFFQVKINKTFS